MRDAELQTLRLCSTRQLLDKHEAIISRGEQAKERYKNDQLIKTELWRIGRPRMDSTSSAGTDKRPSLADLTQDKLAKHQREMEAAQRRGAEELAEGMDGVAHTRARGGERAQSNITLQRSMMDTNEDDDAHTPNNRRRGERAQSSFF